MKPMKSALRTLSVALLAAPFSAAGSPNPPAGHEEAAGWKLLFNGKDLTGWRAYKKPDDPGRIGDGWGHAIE